MVCISNPQQCQLKLSPHVPELGKQHDLQHLAQIGDSSSAAGAALQPDDALDRGDVVEAPAAEIVLEVDELLGELVEHPALSRRSIDGLPCGEHFRVLDARLAPARALGVRADVEAAARQTKQRLVIKAGLGEYVL